MDKFDNFGKILILGVGGYMGKFYMKCLCNLGFDMSKIIGVDINRSHLDSVAEKFPKSFYTMDHEEALGLKPEIALIFVNSRSHLSELIRCQRSGIKKIFIEKPLVYDMAELEKVHGFADTRLYNAFVINFSGVVKTLFDFMRNYDLVVSEILSVWGKNWVAVDRVMGGDAEEEMPHNLCLAHSIIKYCQNIQGYEVSATMSAVPHVRPELILKAKKLEILYPDNMNDSTSATFKFKTDKGIVPVFLLTSFNKLLQERWLEISFVSRGQYDKGRRLPEFKARLDFDVESAGILKLLENFIDPLDYMAKEGGHSGSLAKILMECGNRDLIRIVQAETGALVEKGTARNNKLQDMLAAFLTAVSGGEADPRLVDLEGAKEQMRMLHAAIKAAK